MATKTKAKTRYVAYDISDWIDKTFQRFGMTYRIVGVDARKMFPVQAQDSNGAPAEFAVELVYKELNKSEQDELKAETLSDLVDLGQIGKNFTLNGTEYTFTKFMFRAKANPVVATRVSDGTTHRFGAVRVARALKTAIANSVK